MSITFSYAEGATSLDQFLHKHGDAPYCAPAVFAAGRSVRREAALSGRRDDVPRLRRARPEQRCSAEPRDAGHRGLSQGRLQRSSCSMASTSSSSATTSAPPFWQGRDRAQYPKVVQELKTNLKDVATYFHATAQKIQEGRGLPGSREVVSRLSEVLPGRSGFRRRPTTCSPRRCSRASNSPMRRPNTSKHGLRLSEERQVGDRGLCRAGLLQEGRGVAAAARRRPTGTQAATDAGVKFAQAFPNIRTARAC